MDRRAGGRASERAGGRAGGRAGRAGGRADGRKKMRVKDFYTVTISLILHKCVHALESLDEWYIM